MNKILFKDCHSRISLFHQVKFPSPPQTTRLSLKLNPGNAQGQLHVFYPEQFGDTIKLV